VLTWAWERWVVFGGSWGSTLALVYALHHHDRVLGLILRGIFLGRKREMDWMYKGGADLFFPQAWQRLYLSSLRQTATAWWKAIIISSPVVTMKVP